MVPDVPQIEEALSGDDGLLSAPGDGRLLMVMSTIDPGAVHEIAARVGAEGWRYVDCPHKQYTRLIAEYLFCRFQGDVVVGDGLAINIFGFAA